MSEPVRSPRELTPPAFEMPDGACDAHMLVFGPADRYKGVPTARYSAPKSNIGDYLAMADALRLQRMVFSRRVSTRPTTPTCCTRWSASANAAAASRCCRRTPTRD
jgi:hypothetical protein